MGSLKFIACAGLMAAGLVSGARAADLLPAPAPLPVPEPVAFGGWYLRGDIGFSNQEVDKLDNVLYDATVVNIDKAFDAAPFFGVGLGYQFNSWLRFDVTGEYRARANFHGYDVYPAGPGYAAGSNNYSGSKSEWLFLANAYLDLGTWHGVTPFVGAGVGGSYNTIHSFRDENVPNLGSAYARDASKWNFAWALYAGLAYAVTPNFTVELGYRYVNLGDAQSGDIITYTGTNNVYNPMKFKDLSSHDVKLGMRWMFGGPVVAESYEPIIAKY